MTMKFRYQNSCVAGSLNNNPGPAHYNAGAKDMMGANIKGTGMGTSQRASLTGNSHKTPGPGSFNISSGLAKNVGSSFDYHGANSSQMGKGRE